MPECWSGCGPQYDGWRSLTSAEDKGCHDRTKLLPRTTWQDRISHNEGRESPATSEVSAPASLKFWQEVLP